VHPRRLRHTLATQAINRCMRLEAIAALLGHQKMEMTLIYAKIASRVVADEHATASAKIDALYGPARQASSGTASFSATAGSGRQRVHVVPARRCKPRTGRKASREAIRGTYDRHKPRPKATSDSVAASPSRR
jgi:hypothetical protein